MARLCLVAAALCLSLTACAAKTAPTTPSTTTAPACTVAITPTFGGVTVGSVVRLTFVATGAPPGGTYEWKIASGDDHIELIWRGATAFVKGLKPTAGTGAGATIRVTYHCPSGGTQQAIAGVRVD
ncbi:MAG TPA: hypothetical protein VFM96_14185 [Gaiellaceae bacterium]|nr:hypothetical protein [Gaiellaceae bacterium]